MKHTECKDCKLREGDCGYHHRFNGEVNYDIPSLSSCDKYGNCGHFQQKETPKGDLISRSALKEAMRKAKRGHYSAFSDITLQSIYQVIDNAPTVPQVTVFAENASKEEIEDFKQELEKVLERPQGEWIYKKFDVESGIPHSYWCSNCGEPKSQLSDNFCACCGARMGADHETGYC